MVYGHHVAARLFLCQGPVMNYLNVNQEYNSEYTLRSKR